MPSWTRPTGLEIDKAVAKLARPELVTYFFRNLKNPEWLRPLRERGYFSTPPNAIKTDLGVESPPWPQGEYLTAIAADEPEQVSQIVQSINTNNWNVQLVLIDAALKLPARLSKEVSGHVGNWMVSEYPHPLIYDRVGQLVVQLAQGGEVGAALSLARKLLQVRPPKARPGGLYPMGPAALVDHYEYEELVKRIAAPLRAAAGDEYTSLLFKLLGKAVRFGIRKVGQRGEARPVDNSLWWRPAIENHGQNSPGDIRDILVEAVRDDLVARVQNNPNELVPIWLKLIDLEYGIFQRLGLFLLAMVKDPPRHLVREAILERGWFNSSEFHHEYFAVLEKHFMALTNEDQEAFLARINQVASQKREEDQADWWEYRQLWPIRAYLSGDWKARYEEFRRTLGDLEHPNFLTWTSAGMVGWPSPKSAEELRQLTTAEVVEFLKEWRAPAVAPWEPTTEGLARQVAKVVEDEAPQYARIADAFADLSSEYQQALVDGLEVAVKAGTAFDWAPVLALCHQIVLASMRAEEARYALLRIGALISAGLAKGEAEVPVVLRAEVWAIISSLCGHFDPNGEDDEDPDNDSFMGPLNRSLNSVRGEAMHSAIRYGLWVRRNQEAGPNGAELVARGFAEMPELAQTLTRHLDIGAESSVVIRAVYGQWLPWLNLLDSDWTKAHLDSIFPSATPLSKYRRAAWETYVTYSPAYSGMLPLLRQHYLAATKELEHLPRTRPEKSRDATVHLADHIASFYWRGETPLEDGDGLVRAFYSGAPPWLRSHFAEFLGRSLRSTEGQLLPEVSERLMELWDWRLEVLGDAGASEGDREELSAFAWWVSSAKLPPQWTASRLREVSELVPGTDHDLMFALDEIAVLAATYPNEIAGALENIIRKDKDLWHASAWSSNISEVMRQLVATDQLEARQAVSRTADLLGRRGFLEFREFGPT